MPEFDEGPRLELCQLWSDNFNMKNMPTSHTRDTVYTGAVAREISEMFIL